MKKHWNWFKRKNGNLITNGKRYSLLETDIKGTLLSNNTEIAPAQFIAGGYMEPTEFIEPYIPWWQKIITYLKQLWKNM